MFRLFRLKAKENLQRKESRDNIHRYTHEQLGHAGRGQVGANFAVCQLISGGPDEFKPGPKIRRWLIC